MGRFLSMLIISNQWWVGEGLLTDLMVRQEQQPGPGQAVQAVPGLHHGEAGAPHPAGHDGQQPVKQHL